MNCHLINLRKSFETDVEINFIKKYLFLKSIHTLLVSGSNYH